MQAGTVTNSYDAGLLRELLDFLWSRIAPVVKLLDRYLFSLSLGQLPPVWPVAIDLLRVSAII